MILPDGPGAFEQKALALSERATPHIAKPLQRNEIPVNAGVWAGRGNWKPNGEMAYAV
jgi:hypothetical protein